VAFDGEADRRLGVGERAGAREVADVSVVLAVIVVVVVEEEVLLGRRGTAGGVADGDRARSDLAELGPRERLRGLCRGAAGVGVGVASPASTSPSKGAGDTEGVRLLREVRDAGGGKAAGVERKVLSELKENGASSETSRPNCAHRQTKQTCDT
jgi:hypothetical protein